MLGEYTSSQNSEEHHRPPEKVKPLAYKQERLLARKERLSRAGDVLVRRIPIGAVSPVMMAYGVIRTRTERRRRFRRFCGNDFGLG